MPNGGAELIGFKIRSRAVSDFTFNMHMECHSSDTNEEYVRDFDTRGICDGLLVLRMQRGPLA